MRPLMEVFSHQPPDLPVSEAALAPEAASIIAAAMLMVLDVMNGPSCADDSALGPGSPRSQPRARPGTQAGIQRHGHSRPMPGRFRDVSNCFDGGAKPTAALRTFGAAYRASRPSS